MNKEIHVAFVSNKLKQDFEKLGQGKFEDKTLYNLINKAFDDLKINPSSGVKLQAKLWPKEYIRNFKIANLWKYNLPNGWRLIYTVKEEEVMILSVILEWFSHKEYEKRFKY